MVSAIDFSPLRRWFQLLEVLEEAVSDADEEGLISDMAVISDVKESILDVEEAVEADDSVLEDEAGKSEEAVMLEESVHDDSVLKEEIDKSEEAVALDEPGFDVEEAVEADDSVFEDEAGKSEESVVLDENILLERELVAVEVAVVEGEKSVALEVVAELSQVPATPRHEKNEELMSVTTVLFGRVACRAKEPPKWPLVYTIRIA